MNEATKSFLRSAYKEYYFRHSDSLEFPQDVGSREFGYIPFGGGMVRHLTFKSPGEATAEILKQSPSSAYCSNARYESPGLPIEEKGWLGAELIFDIDATDIPTPCKRGHDYWYCQQCHSSGKLPRPQKCPKCQGGTAEFHGTCRECLAAAKDHARRLVSILVDDFGVAEGAISTFFSGNRGYHLQVADSRFEPLDQPARGEIADYVRGGSLPPSQSIASNLRRRPKSGPEGEGWTRRITRYYSEKREGFTGTIQKLAAEAVTTQRSLVDSAVTADIHRVFRLAGSLHGETGLPKMRVADLAAFDPENDPVVLSSKPVDVKVAWYPPFKLKGTEYAPARGQTVTLPAYAAIQILTRDLGEVA